MVNTTTIHTLPDELLLYVIEWAVEAATLPPSFTDGSNSWTLSHVSSRFRALVLSTPKFWTNVNSLVTGDVKTLQLPSQAVLQRSKQHAIDLHLTWSLRRSNLQPIAFSVPNALAVFCIPFSGRVARLSMYFQNLGEYGDFYAWSRFPPEFFTRISEVHLEFASKGVLKSFRVDPMFDEGLFDGALSPKVTIEVHSQTSLDTKGHGPTTPSRTERSLLEDAHHKPLPDPVHLSFSPLSSRISHLELIGTGLVHTPSEVHILLDKVPELQSFTAWISGARSDTPASTHSSDSERQIELTQLQSLDLTFCDDKSLAESLAQTLIPLITPTLSKFTVSRHKQDSSQGIASNDSSIKVLNSQGGLATFLDRCQDLQMVDFRGLQPLKDLDALVEIVPSAYLLV